MKKTLSKIKYLLFTALLIGTSVVVKAQAAFDQKVLASDRSSSDFLGRKVAVYGNYALVQASGQQYTTTTIPRTETPLTAAGAVYVYKKNTNTGKWEEIQKITAYDRAMYEGFGGSLALNDDYAFIGSSASPLVFPTSGPGAVYVYKRNTTTGVWEYLQKLLATSGVNGDTFGGAISLSGDNIAVGAYTQGVGGAVYVFERNTTTGVWSQKQKLVSSDIAATDRFGYSVSLSGNYLVAGAYYEDEDVAGANTANMAGSIYVFKNTGGSWAQTQKLVQPVRYASNYYGSAVSIKGNDILVGSYNHGYDAVEDNYVSNAGAAFSYKMPSALPVSLVDYTAKLQNSGSVILNWKTVSESNNSHFTIERSTDGITFFPLTSIESKDNNGALYSYTDAKPLNGTNYYKLSQIDKDGTVAVLDIKSVNVSFKNTNYFAINPNPVTGNVINVSVENASNTFYKIALLNIAGQKLVEKTISVSGSNLTIPLESSLTPGIYVLSIEGLGSQKVIIK